MEPTATGFKVIDATNRNIVNVLNRIYSHVFQLAYYVQ
jgi:hypothetical protein